MSPTSGAAIANCTLHKERARFVQLNAAGCKPGYQGDARGICNVHTHKRKKARRLKLGNKGIAAPKIVFLNAITLL